MLLVPWVSRASCPNPLNSPNRLRDLLAAAGQNQTRGGLHPNGKQSFRKERRRSAKDQWTANRPELPETSSEENKGNKGSGVGRETLMKTPDPFLCSDGAPDEKDGVQGIWGKEQAA